ncbi:hypothetical protein BC833DRAFT_35282 [Globomyces pollinis-pini]|nr:hypothetical protein BC833DRAFT_35282 [Globomyces pollinis-pini]
MPYQSEDDYPAEKESIDFQELSNLPSALTRRLSIQSVAASLAMIQFNDVQNVDSPQKALQDKIKDLLGVTENDDFEVRESMDIFSSGLEAETVHGHGRFYNETLQAKDSTALDSINNLMDDVERFLSEMGMGTSKPPPKKEVRNTWEASESDGYNSVHEYIDMVGNRNSFESAQSFDPFPENKSLPGNRFRMCLIARFREKIYNSHTKG